jgi:hypothetical protein
VIPGPVSVEEYERTHHTPAQDDTVLYSTTLIESEDGWEYAQSQHGYG